MAVINTDTAYPDYPLENIPDPGPHDVMCGRGGGTNNHTGNIRFRQLVNEHKLRYLAATKVDKPKVAREVVSLWRKQSPPGRFLTKSNSASVKGKDVTWHDVGDQKAREKASQCLRERTPDVIPFVQSLQHQQTHHKQMKQKKESSKSKSPKAGAVRSNSAVADVNEQAAHLHHLQRLQLLQQQQQQLLALQAIQRGAGVIPDQARSSVNIDSSNVEHVIEYLKRASAPPGKIDFDEESIDPNGSAKEIAAQLFGKFSSEDDVNESSVDDREAMMEVMSKTSWVQSFTSLDSGMLTEHSLGKIAGDDASPRSAPEEKKDTSMMPPPSRLQNMKQAKAMNSNMSMISELTDFDGGLAEVGSVGTNRANKMNKAKGMNSNVSMMSELTNMTGDFSQMGIEEED